MIGFLIQRKKQIALMIACVILGSILALTVFARREPNMKQGEVNYGEKKDVVAPAEKDTGIVTLSPDKLKASDIEVLRIAPETAFIPLMATAAIELNADRTSRVSSRVGGRIVKLMVSQGDRVKTGQPLAFIDTVELDQIWSEYRKNRGRHNLALKNLQREETLFEKNVAPEKDVLKARQELGETEADLVFSRERFRLLGVDVQTVESKKNSDINSRPLIPILSPIGGAIIEKSVTQGEVVSPEKLLFTIADLSTLWVLVDIYEKDMSKLRTGATAHVSVNALPDRTFKGKISYIGDVVNDATRTVKTRVTIENGDGLLKPGMFATVSIDSIKDVNVEKIMAVPEEQVLIDGPLKYVFIRIGENIFKKKDVVLGRSLGKKVEILEGLREGDMLVTKGTFALKSEYKKDALRAQ